jgi:hypothetical protein
MGAVAQTAPGDIMRTHLTLASCCSLFVSATLAQAQPPLPTCEDTPAEGRAVLVGRVLDTRTRLPLQGAVVRVAWDEDGRRQQVETTTDLDGAFSACSLPAATALQATVTFGPAGGRVDLNLVSTSTGEVTIGVAASKTAASGRVVEEGGARGIGDVVLQIEGSEVRVVSAADGSFQLPPMPPGVYVLTTSHVAHGERKDTISIEHGALLQYTISLTESAVPLRPIEVVVRSELLERRGFYERQQNGMGVYLTRSSWQDRSPARPSDILRRVSGVRIVPARGGMGTVLMSRGDCPFRYILDGTPVTSTFQLDDIPVEWIEAVEVYRGVAGLPVQFTASPWTDNAICGVIVVWTRDRR